MLQQGPKADDNDAGSLDSILTLSFQIKQYFGGYFCFINIMLVDLF